MQLIEGHVCVHVFLVLFKNADCSIRIRIESARVYNII